MSGPITTPYTMLIDPTFVSDDYYAKGWKELWGVSPPSGYWPAGTDYDPIPRPWRTHARRPEVPKYLTIHSGRPMDDPQGSPIREPTVTEESVYVRWRCVMQGPPHPKKDSSYREFAVPGAVYAGSIEDPFHAACFAHFGVVMDPDYLKEFLWEDEINGGYADIADPPKLGQYWRDQGQRFVWFGIRRGRDPTSGKAIEHRVTPNFFVFRSCMLGRGNVGMVFTTFKAAVIFAYMDLADAKLVTKGGTPPQLLACKPDHRSKVMINPVTMKLARMNAPRPGSNEGEQYMMALQLSKESGEREERARATASARTEIGPRPSTVLIGQSPAAKGCKLTAALEAGLAESEALRRSSSSTTHPPMFGFTGGEGDDGDVDDDDDGDDLVIVPSTFTVEVLTAETGEDDADAPEDATVLDAR